MTAWTYTSGSTGQFTPSIPIPQPGSLLESAKMQQALVGLFDNDLELSSSLSTHNDTLSVLRTGAVLNYNNLLTGSVRISGILQDFYNAKLVQCNQYVVGMLGTHLARAHVGDLSTWKVGTTGYGGPGDLIDIVVVGSRIAVTDNGDVDYTDDYGDSWTDGGTPGAGPWEALGYFDGNYIIMKADSLKTDNNLAGTWTDRSSDIPASWAGVSPKKIVAAGTDVALILPVAMANPYSVLRTTDGTSFSEGGTFEPDSYLVDMAYNSALEQFLIVDAVGAIWTSDDGGVSWTKRRNGSTWTNETITCVAYYDQGYVFFSTDMAFATTDFNTFRRAFVATGPNSDPWTHAANVGYGTQDRKVLVSGGSGNKIFVRDSNWYSREDS